MEGHMNNFCGATQGNPTRLCRICRILLHLMDKIFKPLEPGSVRKEPSSVKKMNQGSASWEVVKEVLGWTINALWGTIELPDRCK